MTNVVNALPSPDKGVGEQEHRTPEELGGKSKVLPIAQMSDAETPGGT